MRDQNAGTGGWSLTRTGMGVRKWLGHGRARRSVAAIGYRASDGPPLASRSSGSHPSDRLKLRGTQHVVMICQPGSATDAFEAVAEAHDLSRLLSHRQR